MEKLLNIHLPLEQVYEAYPKGTKKNGITVLGVDKGPHFVPDGYSRNGGRFYPRELWMGVSQDPIVQERLKTNRILGSIGHDVEIDDKAIREGLVSHYTTNFNWETGYAESYILDTPAGRIYDAMRRGGVMLYKSTRANGGYVEGKKSARNTPIVDPKTFKFERVDTVFDPGFLEASTNYLKENHCELHESFNEDLDKISSILQHNKFEDTCFDLVECVKCEKLDQDLDKMIRDNLPDRYDDSVNDEEDSEKNKTNLKGENKMEFEKKFYELLAKEQVQAKELEWAQNSVSSIKEELNEAYAKLDENKVILDKVNSLGGVEKLAEAVESSEKYNKIVEELGTFDEISETLNSVEEFLNTNGSFADINGKLEILESYTNMGTVDEVSEILEALNTYVAEVGTLEESKEVLEKAEAFIVDVQALGSFEDIKENLDMLATYKELGEASEIESALERSLDVVTKVSEENNNKTICALAKKYSLDEELVRNTVSSLLEANISISQAEDILANLSSVRENLTDRYNFKKEKVEEGKAPAKSRYQTRIGKLLA